MTESPEPKEGEQKPERTCNDCRFAIFADYGYSNWTTEGTEFFCAKSAHPEDGFDRWFGEDKRLWFGAECPEFVLGDPVEMDVDREELASLTPEQREVWDMCEKAS